MMDDIHGESLRGWERGTARRWALPVVGAVGLVGLGLALVAVQLDGATRATELMRELGGAIVSGAVVALAILLFEESMEEHRARRNELLERKRDVHDAMVADAQMRHALFTALAMRDDLEGITLAGHDLQAFVGAGRSLKNADLSRSDLSRSDLSGSDLSGSDLSFANLSDADLSNAKLSGTNLLAADLSRAILFKTSLPKSNLHMAELKDAQIIGADFTDADMDLANLSGSVVGKAPMLPGLDLDVREGVFEIDFDDDGAMIRGKQVEGFLVTDFSGADLTDANLCGADLSVSDLTNANLRNVVHDRETFWPKGFARPDSPQISTSGSPGDTG